MEFGVVIPEGRGIRKSKYRELYNEFLESAETTARVAFEDTEVANSARNVLNQISKRDGNIVKVSRVGTYVYFSYMDDKVEDKK